MNRRAEILQELARYESPTEPLMRELKSFGWDWSGEPLLILKKEHLLSIIDRFLANQISAIQLQEWAENLEVREDVALDEKNAELLDDIFFRIAAPFVNEPLTQAVVQKMRDKLALISG